ncbi:hypothetical protein SMJ63A_60185 [Stenotrophomonas geniculata]
MVGGSNPSGRARQRRVNTSSAVRQSLSEVCPCRERSRDLAFPADFAGHLFVYIEHIY